MEAITEETKTKGILIDSILRAVNECHEHSKTRAQYGRKQTLKADANLFFSLAFMSVDDLRTLCKQIGI